MKKAITIATMAMLLLCAMAFVGCKEPEPETSNPFIGTWVTNDGIQILEFTETEVSYKMSIMGSESNPITNSYTYSGDTAEFNFEGVPVTAQVDGDALLFLGHRYSKQ